MTGKINNDPRCEQSSDCKAVGGALCRACQMRSRIIALNADPEFAAKNAARMKALHADPEFAAKNAARMKALNADPEFAAKNAASARARMKALNADPEFAAKNAVRMKALNADPEFAAKCGHLTAYQLTLIAHEVSSTSRPYVEIALDWLISPGHVGSIAKKFGVQRRPRAVSEAA